MTKPKGQKDNSPDLLKYIVSYMNGEFEPILALDQQAAELRAHERAVRKKTLVTFVKLYTE